MTAGLVKEVQGGRGGELTLVTWNIHGAVGTDGARAPERIARVLIEIDADIVALQEVPLGGAAAASADVLAGLARATNRRAVAGPTLDTPQRRFGNAVLARWPVTEARTLDLSFGGREPRGALDVDLLCNGEALRVVATHLGLRPRERRAQIAQLLTAFDRPGLPVILAGDINEWLLWGRALRMLAGHFRAAPAPATFPSRWPMLALDRVWMHPASRLASVQAWSHGEAPVASDHLPVVAHIAAGARDR
ncbi:endonuclease/exonuclease/phosphatase family protein [Paraburkholderia guartelaensis]|uniref:Endonuclease/exonuclease/phosphatase family protein n=1 Tax=Paraburkholderia guartelaensis TaxID=2546446 RepID=A0ABU9S4Q6_9BURK